MKDDKIYLKQIFIAGFRDRAIHDYFGIDLEIVRNTLEMDIPILEEQLSRIK